MDRETVAAVLGTRPAGVILAGVGGGNAPGFVLDLLADAAAEGVAVVRSTRIDGGTVTENGEVNDRARGFVAGGALGPQKCRLLLQLLLAGGIADRELLRARFA
jgi:L-asparaginase